MLLLVWNFLTIQLRLYRNLAYSSAYACYHYYGAIQIDFVVISSIRALDTH